MIRKQRRIEHYDGFEYRMTRENKAALVFSCSMRSCKGERRLSKIDSTWVDAVAHNHSPVFGFVQKRIALREAKKKLEEQLAAKTAPVTSNRILVDEVTGRIDDTGLKVFDREKARRMLQYVKRTRTDDITKQLNSGEPLFDSILTDLGDKFLQYDSWGDDSVGKRNFPRVVICASEKALDQLARSTVVCGDGTEKCTKESPFKQLYIIAVKWGSTRFVPSVFAFMEKKDQPSYTRLFQVLQSLRPNWKPKMVLLDLETSVKNSVLLAFKDPPTVSYCLFHYKRAWSQHFKDSGGQWDNSVHVEFFRSVRALACLDSKNIPIVFEKIVKEAPPELSVFIKYLQDYYIRDGAPFSRDSWSLCNRVKNDLPRSNSSIESVNRVLNSACRYYMGELKRPKVSNVLQAIRTLEGMRRGCSLDLPDEPPCCIPNSMSSLDCYGKFAYRTRDALNTYSDPFKQHFQCYEMLKDFTSLFGA